MPDQKSVVSMRHFWLRTWKGRLLIALLIVGIVIAVFISFLPFSRMMAGTPPLTAQELSAAAPGQSVKIAVEVSPSAAIGEISGNLLEQGSAGYRRTNHTVIVQRQSDTPVVMGSASDVHPGAVVQVDGTLQAVDSVQARRIVILSGYVSVQ